MKKTVLACAVLLLSACSFIGAPEKPMPSIAVPGKAPGKVLIIVLPGFAIDHHGMQEEGVAAAIQRGWPEADVVLAGATFPYYRTGTLIQRLHEDVIVPARKRGYKEIWLAGGSMGGMGALMYEQNNPGAMTGILLMSPFLGGDDLFEEFRDAGGLHQWQAGDLGVIDGENYQRHVWKMIQGWKHKPHLARRVWLVCGTEDSLFSDAKVLANEIPKDQAIFGPGEHTWSFWIPAAENVMRKIAARNRD